MTFSEFPTEADLEDFTEAAVDEDGEDEEEEEEVVEDRDYYYDNFKGDDYNEENPTEPSNDGTMSEKEMTHDVKGNPIQSRGSKIRMIMICLEFCTASLTGKSQEERRCAPVCRRASQLFSGRRVAS